MDGSPRKEPVVSKTENSRDTLLCCLMNERNRPWYWGSERVGAAAARAKMATKTQILVSMLAIKDMIT